jgi:hypothetical protein
MTSTYVLDSEAIFFNRELMKSFKEEAGWLWKLSWVYRSNWRVLHIDGFEGGRRLPVGSPVKYRTFFTYGAPPQKTLELENGAGI